MGYARKYYIVVNSYAVLYVIRVENDKWDILGNNNNNIAVNVKLNRVEYNWDFFSLIFSD